MTPPDWFARSTRAWWGRFFFFFSTPRTIPRDGSATSIARESLANFSLFICRRKCIHNEPNRRVFGIWRFKYRFLPLRVSRHWQRWYFMCAQLEYFEVNGITQILIYASNPLWLVPIYVLVKRLIEKQTFLRGDCNFDLIFKNLSFTLCIYAF